MVRQKRDHRDDDEVESGPSESMRQDEGQHRTRESSVRRTRLAGGPSDARSAGRCVADVAITGGLRHQWHTPGRVGKATRGIPQC